MDELDVKKKIVAFLQEIVGYEIEDPENQQLIGENGLLHDSMSVIRFINKIETCFGIAFDDDDLELDSLSNIKKTVEFVLLILKKKML